MQQTIAIASRNLLSSLLWIGIGSAFIATTAWIEVPLLPIPMTMQTYGILVVGGLYGSRLGMATVFAYLLEGMVGLPVFAGGASGIAALLSPSGGYLIGFLPMVGIIGWVADKGWHRKTLPLILGLLLAHASVFILGVWWLSAYVGWDNAIAYGLLPFVWGVGGGMFALKTFMAYASIRGARKILASFKN